MDDPNLQDYQSYLTNRENAGIINNINFFNNLNIKLTLSDEVIESIAEYAYKNKMSLSDISDLLENMLSMATFEIAKNPDIYEEVIITPETIDDNKKYILRKKMKQDEKR